MEATEVVEQPGAGLPRRLLAHATSVVWILAALGVGWLLWPSSLGGCTTLTIVAGRSMEPTYYTGDLVVSRCGIADVGDVIVYTPPGVDGARVIHRIVDGDAEGWIVQGDNNDFTDPWLPTQEDILGSPVLHLPGVGRFASILLSPLTWISLLVVALAVVIWPGKQPEETDDGDEPDGLEDGVTTTPGALAEGPDGTSTAPGAVTTTPDGTPETRREEVVL